MTPKPLWAVENNMPDLVPDYHKTIEVLQYYFDLVGVRSHMLRPTFLRKAIDLAGLAQTREVWAWCAFCVENFQLYFNLAPIDQSVME